MLSQGTDRAKQTLLNELDQRFQFYFHANLQDVVNDLRLHYVEIRPDPSPDELMAAIDVSGILDFVPMPSIGELRDAVRRVKSGTYGFCIGCRGAISSDILESEPNAKFCSECSRGVNQPETS